MVRMLTNAFLKTYIFMHAPMQNRNCIVNKMQAKNLRISLNFFINLDFLKLKLI